MTLGGRLTSHDLFPFVGETPGWFLPRIGSRVPIPSLEQECKGNPFFRHAWILRVSMDLRHFGGPQPLEIPKILSSFT